MRCKSEGRVGLISLRRASLWNPDPLLLGVIECLHLAEFVFFVFHTKLEIRFFVPRETMMKKKKYIYPGDFYYQKATNYPFF